jgi:hypothetical protein
VSFRRTQLADFPTPFTYWAARYRSDKGVALARHPQPASPTVSTETVQLLISPNRIATADHPMINRLWRERLTLSDRLLAVRRQAPFSTVRRLEALRSTATGGAKRIRDFFDSSAAD